MEKITIKNYSDLLEIKKDDNEIEIIIDECCSISTRKRVIDFLSGLSYQNGTIKKIDKNTYKVIIKN